MISSVEVSNETEARLELERVREFAQAVLAREGDRGGLALAFVEEPDDGRTERALPVSGGTH